MDDLQSAARDLGELTQDRQEPLILLHGDYASAGVQQGAGEAAGAWADLDHRLARYGLRQAGDLAADVQVEEEVLAKPLVRGDPGIREELAQGRQVVRTHAAARRAAISAA